jgi:DNA-3-methyladenine glycosylase II
MTPDPLDEESLRHGVAALGRKDRDLARITERLGMPPLWRRPPGFATLVGIVLEQQVSLASARATFDRLLVEVEELDAAAFLGLTDETLRQCGFSRQKSRYCRSIAEAVHDGQLDLEALSGLPDESVRERLVAITGIGPWTANIYLLMALGRRDVWPVGDLALAIAVQRVKCLETRPSTAEMEAIGEAWRPWRSVASRLLWQSYLNDSKRVPD